MSNHGTLPDEQRRSCGTPDGPDGLETRKVATDGDQKRYSRRGAPTKFGASLFFVSLLKSIVSEEICGRLVHSMDLILFISR
jgi:hypothetical protein